jgi:hypothetical protein
MLFYLIGQKYENFKESPIYILGFLWAGVKFCLRRDAGLD